MEWVPGMRITDHCDQHRLDTTRRLELFIQVCLAIQHAHEKGILHRDTKPSNILVTPPDADSVPKVIDFGIAKAIEGHPAGDAFDWPSSCAAIAAAVTVALVSGLGASTWLYLHERETLRRQTPAQVRPACRRLFIAPSSRRFTTAATVPTPRAMRVQGTVLVGILSRLG